MVLWLQNYVCTMYALDLSVQFFLPYFRFNKRMQSLSKTSKISSLITLFDYSPWIPSPPLFPRLPVCWSLFLVIIHVVIIEQNLLHKYNHFCYAWKLSFIQ